MYILKSYCKYSYIASCFSIKFDDIDWTSLNILSFSFKHKIKFSQVLDRKPKNNPIQGRCY